MIFRFLVFEMGWMEEQVRQEDDVFSLGYVEFVVFYRIFREKCLVGIWIERFGIEKKYRILQLWRGFKKLFYVLKIVDLKLFIEFIFVVVKDENIKDRIQGFFRRLVFNFFKINNLF